MWVFSILGFLTALGAIFYAWRTYKNTRASNELQLFGSVISSLEFKVQEANLQTQAFGFKDTDYYHISRIVTPLIQAFEIYEVYREKARYTAEFDLYKDISFIKIVLWKGLSTRTQQAIFNSMLTSLDWKSKCTWGALSAERIALESKYSSHCFWINRTREQLKTVRGYFYECDKSMKPEFETWDILRILEEKEDS